MDEEYLYTYGRYAVVLVDDALSEDTGKAELAYGVLNTETGVIEARQFYYHYALRWAQVSENESKKFEAITEDGLVNIQGDMFNAP